MRCEEFEKLLDGEGAATTPEAAAHAESCLSCGRALERWNAARRELRALGDEPAPPFLATRVMAAIRAESDGRTQPAVAAARRRLRLVPALAVLVMAALGGWVFWQALRSGGAPVEEVRVAAAGKHDREDTPPALADRAAPPAVATPPVAPAAPVAALAPQRRAAAKSERSEKRSSVAGLESDLAPQPVAAPVATNDAGREQRGFAGGAVGGALAAAPVAADAASPAAGTAAMTADRRLGKGAPSTLDEMKVLPGSVVNVQLTAPGGALVFGGGIDLAAAPPSGTWWRVRVTDGGALSLLDADRRDIGAAHPGTLAFLHSRRLAPGEYRLSR